MMNHISHYLGKNLTMFSLPQYDDHTHGQARPGILQLGLFQLWCGALFLLVSRYLSGRNTKNSMSSSSANGQRKDTQNEIKVTVEKDSEVNGTKSQSQNGEKATEVKTFSAVKPPPTLDEFLKALVILGVIMMYFYAGDYAKLLPRGERTYARDTFLFLVFLLFLVGCAFTIKPTPDKILNRDQTEEWKGWMQVMFVWYHYFAAKEWYNWIRVYIAAYVWMTGFGNFSFFWVRADFSLWRVLKMLFRLNFLVLLICAVVSNEYMLYYICAMHTHWFLSVYATMSIYPSINKTKYGMPLKFAIYAACNFLIFDVGDTALYVFRPLYLILGFNDGKTDIMHEWQFRAGLDHWVAFIGMLCAYFYPNFEAFLLKLEKEAGKRQHYIKAITAAVLGAIFIIWLRYVLPLEKFEYNSVHPYTSFIPILCFIFFRNMYPVLRTRYIHLFAFLGKITLETYLSQLHIYLQSNAKHLIVYLPDYPLLNFALVTTIYLIVSYIIFNLTTDLSAYLLPKDNFKAIGKNCVYFLGLLASSCCLSWIVLSLGLV